jgi:hypothetical protein
MFYLPTESPAKAILFESPPSSLAFFKMYIITS